MINHIPISGFTIVRNAEFLDYPLKESVSSLLPLCNEFVINVGDSGDRTQSLCRELQSQYPERIRLITSVWDIGKEGGFQLRNQTNLALEHCQFTWCFYLQADEVLHEADWPLIAEAITKAESDPTVDGILFHYYHFYGNYDYTIRGRNWYRSEVRAFKAQRGISSFRDAQGFRKNGKRLHVLNSGARIFHYGHVRTLSSRKRKAEEMAKWWLHEPQTRERDLDLIRHFGLASFTKTHPKVMHTRIAKFQNNFSPKQCRRKWDWNEIKDVITILWEALFPYRLGEFRNYERAG